MQHVLLAGLAALALLLTAAPATAAADAAAACDCAAPSLQSAPVCSAGGITVINSCAAACQNLTILYDGACANQGALAGRLTAMCGCSVQSIRSGYKY